MKIRSVFGILAIAGGLSRAQDDVLVKAMRDEMDRTMKQLQLENLEKPYYVAFRVIDADQTNVSARFGALQTDFQSRFRIFLVEVRVGDNKVDNTNFFSPGGGPVGRGQLTIEDDYRELRRQMWLITDAAYKKAVEDLSKKRAVLQNQNNTDETPDFTKETPNQTSVDMPVAQADRAKWEALARNLSGLFRQMPGIYTSSVSFSASNSYIHYLNSEGTSYTRRQPSVGFTARAATQAPDGTPLDDSVEAHAVSIEGLPSGDELATRVKALGQRLTDLRTAKELENYNGPVLAEGDAAAQLFRYVFAPSLLGSHRVVMDMGRQQGGQENPFIDKVGARVLPDFLSVTDNPLVTEYNKIPVLGGSKVDEDGMPTREVKLVEKGILKTLLVTRNPVRGMEHSTGSRHAGGATPTNLIVTAENGLGGAELRAKFLDLVKQRNKEFGIVVRKMRNGSAPVMAYKVYADGREELIHGVEFAGLNAASFKEIAAASKDANLVSVEFRPQQGPAASLSGDGDSKLVAFAVPSLLFEDVTVRKARGETPKPPVAAHPFFETK
jgi:predicted Zn-dependent protease